MDTDQINLRLKRFILDKVLVKPDQELDYDSALISNGLLDSFSALEVAIFSEETFRVKLSDDQFGTVDCINDISKIIIGAKAET